MSFDALATEAEYQDCVRKQSSNCRDSYVMFRANETVRLCRQQSSIEQYCRSQFPQEEEVLYDPSTCELVLFFTDFLKSNTQSACFKEELPDQIVVITGMQTMNIPRDQIISPQKYSLEASNSKDFRNNENTCSLRVRQQNGGTCPQGDSDDGDPEVVENPPGEPGDDSPIGEGNGDTGSRYVGDSTGITERYFNGVRADKTSMLSAWCRQRYGSGYIEREEDRAATTQESASTVSYVERSSNCEQIYLDRFTEVVSHPSIESAHSFSRDLCSGDDSCIDMAYQAAGLSNKNDVWLALRGSVDPSMWSIVDRTLKNQYFPEFENCEEKQEEAQTCCGDPLSCAMAGNKALGGVANLGLTLGTVIQSARGAQGNAEACRQAKELSLSGAALNTGLAGLCTNKVEGCKSTCESSRKLFQDTANMMNDICENRFNTLQSISGFCVSKTKISDQGRAMKSKIARCQAVSESANDLAQQAAANTTMAAFLQECEDSLTQSETGLEGLPDTEIAFNGDCTSAANASNPICIQCNADPSAVGCEDITTTTSGLTTSATEVEPGTLGAALSSDTTSLGLDSALLDDPFSNPEFADPMAVEAQQLNDPTVSSSGGSGGAGLGGSGDSGGLPPVEQPQSVNGKLNTDILTGERGGSGAVSSLGETSSGGGYSYGRNPASLVNDSVIDAHKKSGFDLSKYLPGSKGKAKLPGLSRGPNGNVGKMTDNIFDMVSRRYRLRCLQGKFYGCPGGGKAPVKGASTLPY
tara:strand:+ start:53522 stop:55780 length:2259 start_codon:yes stop_codon:yes gene_type:complete